MASTVAFLRQGQAIAPGVTAAFRGQLVDEAGAAVGSAALSAFTLKLVDADDGAIVNGLASQNILNTDRGTVDASGNIVVTLTPADTALLVSTDKTERRSMVLTFTYTGGKVGKHECQFLIKTLSG